MSLASRAGDLYFTFRFLKMLTTPWEQTDAYNLGLIDENGKRIKGVKIQSPEEKTAYSPFFRLAFHVKRLINKLPGGTTKLASYAAALFLLREKFQVSDANLSKICKELDIDPLDFISENTAWYIMENNQLAPGIYRVKDDKMLTVSLEDVVKRQDKIRVNEDSFPVSDIFGLKIYEGIHLNTQQKIHFTIGEIYK